LSLGHSVDLLESFEGNVATEVPVGVAQGTTLRQGLPASELVASITRLLDLKLVVYDVATTRGRWLPAQLDSAVGFLYLNWAHNSRD